MSQAHEHDVLSCRRLTQEQLGEARDLAELCNRLEGLDLPLDFEADLERLLVDRDPSARIAFEVRARNEFFDLEPVLDHYRAARTSTR